MTHERHIWANRDIQNRQGLLKETVLQTTTTRAPTPRIASVTVPTGTSELRRLPLAV